MCGTLGKRLCCRAHVADSPIMVNGPLPGACAARHANVPGFEPASRAHGVVRRIAVSRPRFTAFVQTLGKSNVATLAKIFVNYAENRARTANVTFKRAC